MAMYYLYKHHIKILCKNIPGRLPRGTRSKLKRTEGVPAYPTTNGG